MAEAPNEKKFMRETIVKPPVSRGQIARRLLALILFAVIFGVVAAVSFVVSWPVAEQLFGTEPPSTAIPITIERDDEPGSYTAPTETMEETPPEPLQSEAVREEMEQMLDEALAEFPWEDKHLEELNQLIVKAGQAADKSIVTVSSVRQQTDWFDNPVESMGQYAGVILAVNENEVVILTMEAALEGADELRVIFGDGGIASGEVKQRDTVAGLAAIRVNTAELGGGTKSWIEAIELGNSYTTRAGDMVVAVGSPAGWVHSVKYGRLSYVAKGVQIPDGQTRVLYADFDCYTENGTFLLNMNGQLLGWASVRYQEETPDGVTALTAISEYKGMLQKLSNGIEMPYFGIMAQEVSGAMQEQGVPEGIYITESIADGPAYSAGIQNGDIITRIQTDDIVSIRDFQVCLENVQSGENVTVVVQRKGIDEYKEIEYSVTIGAR